MPDDPLLRRVYTVTGEVQRVGFREIVRKIAIRLGVSGRVSNLPDDSVEVVCEGTGELLDTFSSAISIRKGLIQVSHVLLKEESPVESGGRFFEVVRGAWEDEMAERADAAVGYLGMAVEKIDIVGEKVDNVGLKVDEVGRKVDNVGLKVDEVGQKVDNVGIKVDEVGR
ncbi:MAG TPA: acylphosphatase, partial [Thermoplasmata archaeon]|nr:acylphosphatase [Thermoplasmata archaeon]